MRHQFMRNINQYKYEDGTPLRVGDKVIYTEIGSGGCLHTVEGVIRDENILYWQIKTTTGVFHMGTHIRNNETPLNYDDGRMEVKRMFLRRA